MLGHRLPCETPAAHRSKAPPSADTRFVLPATILGSSLSFIDGSVVNVALPSMQRSLGAELTTMQWVVNGYMLTLASLILLGGSAADHFGRGRIFLIGLVGFLAASLACGLAPSAGWLVAARLVQGGAAALLMPSSLAIIGSAYTGEARGPAIGTWAAAGAITTALGPPLGGWLVDSVGWRAIFFINLPIGAMALWLGTKLPSDRPVDRPAPLDTRGAALAIATLGTISYGLIALGAGDRLRGAIAVTVSIITAWSFIRSEARSAAPMLPLALFRNPVFAGANVLTVLLYAAVSASMFLLPFLLIEVHGYSATAAGAAFLPFSAIMGLGSRWAGGLVERVGPRIPLLVGPALTSAGFVILGLRGDGSSFWTGVLPGLTVVAIGMTLSVAPLTTTVFDSVAEEQMGTASGVNSAAARTGGLLAVAALGLSFGRGDAPVTDGSALIHAYRVVMLAAAALAGLSALTAALTIKRREEAA